MEERLELPLAGVQGLLGPPALGDVPAHGLRLHKLTNGIKEAPVDKLHPPDLPGAGIDPVLNDHHRVGRRQGVEPLFDQGQILGDGLGLPCAAHQLLAGPAEEPAEDLVYERVSAVLPEAADDFRLVLHHRPVTILARAHRGLRLVARGDILPKHGDAEPRALATEEVEAQLQPACLVVNHVLDGIGSFPERPLIHVIPALGIVGGQQILGAIANLDAEVAGFEEVISQSAIEGEQAEPLVIDRPD